MALGNETLPLGGDEANNWQNRNLATPSLDAVGDTAYQAFGGPGAPQPAASFDGTVTPEMWAQMTGAPPDPGAQLAQAPQAPDIATPVAQAAPMPQDGAPAAPGAAQAPQGAPPPGVAPPEGAAPPATALQPLGPAPAQPPLTGDPTKDVQNNILWHRELTNYQALAAQHGQALEQHKAAVESKKADRELAMEQHAATIHNDEAKQFAERSQKTQQAVDQAVGERVNAYKDLSEGNGFLDASLGDKVLGAIIFAMGDKQATLQNVAAAQLGQVGHFENQGLKTIEGIMQRRYNQKLQRLKAASDNVLEAQYGQKNALENHRAALNDLDADLAANYRLAGKEAEQQLRSRGADAATVAGNAVVAGLYQSAADAEGKIHEREEELGVKRETAAATNKLAGAHLNLAERQAAATEAQRGETNAEARQRIALTRDQMNLAHADRQDAAGARQAAAAEKKAAADDARTLRDPDTGEPIAVMPTPKGVTASADKLVASRAYSKGLRELADDLEKNKRVAPGLPLIGNVTDASKNRDELYNNVIARGRKALDLGVSNANIQIEHGSIGGAGKGLGSMADPKVLRRIADEQDKIADERIRSGGKTMPGALPPTEKTGGAPAGGRAPAPASAQPSAKPPDAIVNKAWQAVQDPKAPPAVKQKAVEVLTAAGML